jgi:hypothetical protein
MTDCLRFSCNGRSLAISGIEWHILSLTVKAYVLFVASIALLLLEQAPGQNAGQSAASAKSLTSAQVWALDATYSDPQHGVTFQYPSVWRATTQFAYHPPALTRSDHAKPIAGFGYSEGGFPRSRNAGPYSDTDLEGFGVVYSAVRAANAKKCDAMAAAIADSPKHSRVVLGQRTFSDYETGEDFMSQSISGDLYVTYENRTCYFFEADVALASPAVLEDIPGLTAEQLRAIYAHLFDIVKSFRIVTSSR